uniref:RxLR effector candidate protein n=1 Tax=Hyaloperonospora arabidopsidis (strain Emoy2) TaxID=559515 RepID=M4B432_HYAAE
MPRYADSLRSSPFWIGLLLSFLFCWLKTNGDLGTGLIALSTCKAHLTALFIDTQTGTHTDKYDLKVRHSTLRTVSH